MASAQLKNVDLGKLVDKLFPFDSYRVSQKEIIIEIIKAFEKKKFVILDAPTGCGKSAIGITVARYFERAHIITIQKLLQDQYIKDFKDIFIMKGRSNYTCNQNGKPCSEGECRLNKAKRDRKCGCPYLTALNVATRSNKVMHNFDSFYYQKKVFKKRPFMLIDEAHNIEQKFMNFISFTIDNDLFSINIPKFETVDEYIPFIEKYEQIVNKELVKLEDMYEKNRDQVKFEDELTSLSWKLESFLRARKSKDKIDFIMEYSQSGRLQKLKLKPIQIDQYTGQIFNYADKILCMSATIINQEQFIANAGIEESECCYIQVPTTFPIENRKIYATGELDLKYKKMHEEVLKIPAVIKRYLDMFEGERGIIHTHTNKLVEVIRNKVKSSRLVFKDNYKDMKSLLERHAAVEGSVIVASGFHEGLDLKDDLSRFQLILKVPYPDLRDEQIKRRMELDKAYYGYLTALKLVQSYGRSVRSDNDFCDTFILDKNFRMFYGMYKKMLPDFFREAIDWM